MEIGFYLDTIQPIVDVDKTFHLSLKKWIHKNIMEFGQLAYLIGLGVLIFAAMPAALIFYARYWNGSKFLKAQLNKSPINTFGGEFSAWKEYTFNEDDYRPFEKLQGPFWDKALSPKGLFWISILFSNILMAIPIILTDELRYGTYFFLLAFAGLIPPAVFYRKSYGRYKAIQGERESAIRRMYEVANTALKFDPMYAYSPSAVVNVSKWKDKTIPSSVVIIYPTTFRADTQGARESFESIFNTAITEENAWIYTWHPTKNAVQCRPVEDLPKMIEYKGTGPFEWHTFPLGVGLGPKGQEIISYSVNKNKTGIYYPHVLIAGTTGSGKSVIQRNIIFHCIQHNDMWRFLGVDLKRVELSRFRRYTKTVLGIATDLEEGVEIVKYAHDVMMERYRKMEEAGVTIFLDMVDEKTGKPEYAILLMIDEAFMFMSPEGNKTEEGKARDMMHAEASQVLGDIARLGRAAGVHLVLATQRPDASVIKGELKNNLDVRIAAGRLDGIPSNMVLDSQAATMLPGEIKGRGVVRIGGELRPFQGFYADQDWIDNWLAKPQNRWREPDLFKDKGAPKLKSEEQNEPERLSIPEPSSKHENEEFIEVADFPEEELNAAFNSDNKTVPMPMPKPANSKKEIEETVEEIIASEVQQDVFTDEEAENVARSFMFDDEIDDINNDNITPEEIEALLAELAAMDDIEDYEDEESDTGEIEPINLGEDNEEDNYFNPFMNTGTINIPIPQPVNREAAQPREVEIVQEVVKADEIIDVAITTPKAPSEEPVIASKPLKTASDTITPPVRPTIPQKPTRPEPMKAKIAGVPNVGEAVEPKDEIIPETVKTVQADKAAETKPSAAEPYEPKTKMQLPPKPNVLPPRPTR